MIGLAVAEIAVEPMGRHALERRLDAGQIDRLVISPGPCSPAEAGISVPAIRHFAGRLPIREAFTLGRIMVVPSRNESFPYVVLEAAAARIRDSEDEVFGEVLTRGFGR